MLKKIDLFIVGLLSMIGLAYFVPGIGSAHPVFNLENISGVGISLIFFFYGLKLSPRDMKKGLSNYKLHILSQLSTFVFFGTCSVIKTFYKNRRAGTYLAGHIFYGCTTINGIFVCCYGINS